MYSRHHAVCSHLWLRDLSSWRRRGLRIALLPCRLQALSSSDSGLGASGWRDRSGWTAEPCCSAISPPIECSVGSRPGSLRDPSVRFANGHTLDRDGAVIRCEHGRRCISRVASDGSVSVLVDRYQGLRLDSPNDVVVALGRNDLVHRSSVRDPFGPRGARRRVRARRQPCLLLRSAIERSVDRDRAPGGAQRDRPSRPMRRCSTSPIPRLLCASTVATATSWPLT